MKRIGSNTTLVAEKFTFKGKTLLCRVVEVYDGDTITVVTRLSERDSYYKYKLRLYGVDAPEVRGVTNKYGTHVRDLLSDLINGQEIIVDFVEEDKYGRLMGEIWIPEVERNICYCFFPDIYKKGINVNKLLLERGVASGYDGGKKIAFTEAQLENILLVRKLVS
jgi:micrococcal nuclease